jgi:putative two-component system response regulator
MDKLKASRILIVDDEEANVLLIERTLQQVGVTTFKGVTDPREVEGLLTSFKPDIIMLDIQMPYLDGFAVMRRLKELIPKDEFLPIIILTADATPETKRKALTEGANDFLTKPFDLSEVILRTRNLLRSRLMHCELRATNEILEERVRERTAALERAQVEMLERLSKAGEFRDDDTGEHTKRVGNLSALIGRVLGMAEPEAEMLRMAAQLHDIGKTGIPDKILLKPGKLSIDEFDTMKAHTTIGSQILGGSDARILQMAEEIALTHHERWTGGGYPYGLRGEQIPLSGRIVAIADVFDALTHARPYKLAWSVADAVEEIKRQSGQHFDPRVVDALLQVLTTAGLYTS